MNKSKRENIDILLFTLPALSVFFIFFYYPIISSFFYSMFDWQGFKSVTRDDYIGFKNYIEIFSDKIAISSFINTLKYTVVVVIFQNLVGLIFALIVDSKIKTRNMVKTMLFIPCLLSSVVVGFTWAKILDPFMGIINYILDNIGLSSIRQDWLGNGEIALYSVMFVAVWQWSGYFMVIYLSGLQSIQKEVIESSKIDGSSWWQGLKHIVFPLLAPSFTVGVVLSTIWALKVFDIIFILTRGGPGYSTEVIMSQIYFQGFINDRNGYSTALSIVLFLIVFLVGIIQLAFLRKREDVF